MYAFRPHIGDAECGGGAKLLLDGQVPSGRVIGAEVPRHERNGGVGLRSNRCGGRECDEGLQTMVEAQISRIDCRSCSHGRPWRVCGGLVRGVLLEEREVPFQASANSAVVGSKCCDAEGCTDSCLAM